MSKKNVKVRRDLLTTTIREILSYKAEVSKEEISNFNAQMLVAGLAGLLAEKEPEMSNALCELIQIEPDTENQ